MQEGEIDQDIDDIRALRMEIDYTQEEGQGDEDVAYDVCYDTSTYLLYFVF
jgi:hypothetical protein